MKISIIHLVLAALMAASLCSCSTMSQFSPGKGNKYQYGYKLVYPVENSDLLFQDDSIIVQFKFDDAAVRFQMQNISDSYVSVDWAKASMGMSGRYFAIRHSTNLYQDSLRSESILLPPLGFVRELAIPRDNIYDNGERWVETDLFPTVDQDNPALREAIRKSPGQRVSLLLPIFFGSVEKTYEFDFQVDSVKQIPWKNFTPYQRIPAPPLTQRSAQKLDNVTTAVIAVGVLGFSAYVLSVKKNPPSE